MWGWMLRLLPTVAKASPLVLAFLAGSVGGWYVTNQYHEERAHEAALKAAIERAEQGRREYAKIMRINDELDASMRRIGGLSAELDRVRKLAAKRAAARAGDVDAGAVGKCERLLSEGSELLVEGGELLQRNALRHDALVRATE